MFVRYVQVCFIILLSVLHISVQVYHQNEITTKPANDLDKNWYPKYANNADGVKTVERSDRPSIRGIFNVVMHHNYSRIGLQRSDPNLNPGSTQTPPEQTHRTHIQKIPRKPKNKDEQDEKLSVLPLTVNARDTQPHSDETETNSYRPDIPANQFFNEFPDDDDTQQQFISDDQQQLISDDQQQLTSDDQQQLISDDQQQLVENIETFSSNENDNENIGQTQQEIFPSFDQKQETSTVKTTTSSFQREYYPVYRPAPVTPRQPVYVDPKLLNRTISAHSHIYQPTLGRHPSTTTPKIISDDGYNFENPYQTDDTQQVEQEFSPTYQQTTTNTDQQPSGYFSIPNQQTNPYSNAHSYQTGESQTVDQRIYQTYQPTFGGNPNSGYNYENPHHTYDFQQVNQGFYPDYQQLATNIRSEQTPGYSSTSNQLSNTYSNTHFQQTSESQQVGQPLYPTYQNPVITTPSQQVRGHYLTYIPNPVTLPTLFQQPAYINPNLVNGNIYVHTYRPSQPISSPQSQEIRGYLNCPDKATGQFPYALDCKQFLNCWKGRGFIQNCGPGTVFNPKTQECDFPGKVKCVAYKSQADVFDSVRYPKSYLGKNRNELGEHSEHLEDFGQNKLSETAKQEDNNNEERIFCPRGFLGLKPHPIFCNKFINCSQNEVTVEHCMFGMHFNSITSNCDFPQFVNCEDKRLAKFSEQNVEKTVGVGSRSHSLNSYSTASTSKDAVYVPHPGTVTSRSSTKEVQCPTNLIGLLSHPYDCNLYLNCASGRTTVQKCGPGTMFNPKISTCDFSGNVKCQQTGSISESRYQPKEKENAKIEYPPEVTVKEAKCPDGFTGLLPHPNDCKQFLNCANGRTFTQSCGPGTVFNSEISACDYPSRVSNCEQPTPSIDIRTMPKENPSVSEHQPLRDIQLGRQREKQSKIEGQYNYDQQNYQNFDHIHGQESRNVETVATNQNNENTGDYQHFWNQNNREGQRNVYDEDNQQRTVDQQENTYEEDDRNRSIGSFGSLSQTNLHHHQHRNRSRSFTSQNQWHGQSNYEQNQRFWNQRHDENQENEDNDNQQLVVDQEVNSDSDTRNKNVETFNPLEQPNFHHHHHQHPKNFTNHQHHYHFQRHNHSYTPQNQWRPTIPRPQYHYHHQHSPEFHHYHHHNRSFTWPHHQRDKFNPPESTTPSDQNVEEEAEFVIDERQRESKDLNTAGTSNFGPNFVNQPESKSTTPRIFFNVDDSFFKPVFTESPRNQLKPVTTPQPTPKQTTKSIPPYIPPKSRDTREQTQFTNPNALVPSRFNTIKTTPVPPRTLQKSMCLPAKFECAPDICLALQYVCDGFPHCPNGADEANCTRYVINFIEHKDQRMMGHDVQKWTTDLDTCAKYCMSSKNFTCKSFSYRKSDKLCILNDKVAGETGDIRTFNEFTYYEAKEHSMDCKDQYKCDNLRCIDLFDVCNTIDNCGDNSDEKYCTSEYLNFAVRLVGSKNVNEGRLEVRAFGRWGSVCDDKFSLRDANVACQELGFPLGAVQVQHNPYYYTETNNVQESKNTTLILMDEVECLGNETSLKDCQFNGWGVHDCKPEEVVGLVCKTKSVSCPDGYWLCQKSMECIPLAFLCDHVNDCDDSSDEMPNICEAKLEFRLVNGSTPLEGRVEIRHFGVWGTVCDDDFDDQAAKVICRHMGYNGPARALKGGMFGPGTGPIWLDQLNCVGNESSVDKCLHNEWGKNNCEHSEDSAVICSRSSESPLKKAPGTYGVPTPRRIDQQLTLADVLPKVCGVRDEGTFAPSSGVAFRVVAGSVAQKGHYPWQASLRVRGQSKMSHWCGAVIITPIHVLTAAHCLVGFSKSSYVIRAGDYESEVDEGTEEEAYIEEFYIHEQFRKGHHMNNDIAMIKLKGRGFNLGKHIQAICLPHQQTQYAHGKNCTISGWGSTASGKLSAALQLRAGWIPIQSPDICKQPQVYGKSIQDGMFCAGNLDEGVDACDGDSGGPLACLDNGLFTLYGITSWGQHCGYANKPGVYVKVGYYRDWIDDTIKKSLK